MVEVLKNKSMTDLGLPEEIGALLGQISTITEDIITVNDLEANILYYNNPKGFQLPRNEILGKKSTEFFDFENSQLILNNLKSIKNGKPVKFETKITFNGITIFLSSCMYPIRNNKGVIVAAVTQTRDITQQKMAEKSLKESEEKYKTVTELSKDFIFIIDQNFKVLYVNKAGAEKFRLSPSDLVNMHIQQLFPKGVFEEQRKKIQAVFDRKKTVYSDNESSFMNKKTWLNTWLIPQKDEKGEVKAVLGISRDITERKLYEEELRKAKQNLEKEVQKRTEELKLSRDQLSKIINSTREIIIAMDSKGRITKWNRAIETLTGIKEKELFEANKRGLENIYPLLSNLKSAIKKKSGNLFEREIMTDSGQKRIILCNTSIIYDEKNKVTGAVLIGRDISEENNLTKKLEKGNSYFADDISLKELLESTARYEREGYTIVLFSRHVNDQTEYHKNLKIIKYELKQHPDEKADIRINNYLAALFESIKLILSKNPQSIVILSRIEYLFCMVGTNRLMRLLYALNELMSKRKSILILSYHKKSLNEKWNSLLCQEFQPFPKIKKPELILHPKKTDILKYISNMVSINQAINYGSISKKFLLSRATTKKWINELESRGLISTERQGKTKYISIKEKGKAALASMRH